MRTHILSIIDESLLYQHRNPVAFFQDLERRGVWHLLWPTRLVILICGLVLLPATLFVLSGERWVILATVVAACVLIMLSGAFMIVASPIAGSRPLLWISYLFLYHFSGPFLLVVLLCAVAPLTSVGLWLGWLIGLPWLLGVSVADACALAVYQSARQRHEKQTYWRQGGPVADLPELTLWQWAGATRLSIGTLLGISGLIIAWLYGREGGMLSVAMLSGAAGCVRLEATVLTLLDWPLATRANGEDRWHATYAGRTALWAGAAPAQRALLSVASEQAASAVMLALVQEGCLSRDVRRACSQLPDQFIQAILLQLSLAEGGAALLGFLQTGLSSPASRRLAELYATLAAEAAKPLDLQRWIALLPEESTGEEATAQNEITLALIHTRQALLQYQPQPIVTSAAQELRQSIQSLDANAPQGRLLSWPHALWINLAQYQQRLDETKPAGNQTPITASL